MATKSEIIIITRLTALEILVQHILFMIASATDDPVAELEKYKKRVLAEYSEATISEVDAATSDLLAQHLSEELERILAKVVARAQESLPR